MLDRAALDQAVERHGSVVRVVICAHQGSSPRGAGAAMLVWSDLSDRGGQSGSIGGGALEFEAARRARAILSGTRLSLCRSAPNWASAAAVP